MTSFFTAIFAIDRRKAVERNPSWIKAGRAFRLPLMSEENQGFCSVRSVDVARLPLGGYVVLHPDLVDRFQEFRSHSLYSSINLLPGHARADADRFCREINENRLEKFDENQGERLSGASQRALIF